ncbi:hypothetical protein Spb1_10980 [Planctopirus ephydatiae]|uniref:Putative restriction endonuclease domain-containing protein n=1 Tax=Planctopirus ephydatiae TaxID=2528019 RepID=A0A518GKR6_9PLAN|nr:Uma2 family endonuclease [Planctopirus ephydatiae]QDV29220.1 hypothetical protein Spb1_10980 [Planctopirus ephydatiae]
MAHALTTPKKAETQLWIDDLFRQLEEIEGKAEIVDGGIFLMSPADAWHTIVSGLIYAQLLAYQKKIGRGIAVSDNGTFRCELPHRQSFSPDAAFYVGPDVDMGPFPLAPIFAVEIRSQHDYGAHAERVMAAKREDYFAAGTMVVWDVDLLSTNLVKAYRRDAPEVPAIFSDVEIADAEPALPGWKATVREFLPGNWKPAR